MDNQSSQTQMAERLLQIVSQLASELRQGQRQPRPVTLDSRLERDLGLDSLSRVELLQRIEKSFQVRLPEQLLARAETPRDLLQGMMSAPGRQRSGELSAAQIELPGIDQQVPLHAQTLVDVLLWQVKKHPQRPHIYLYGDADEAQIITYAELLKQARTIACKLQKHELEPAQTVAIMLPTGREYLFTFFAILLLGAIPVPIYPPTRPSQLEEHLRRHAAILDNAGSVLLITVAEARLPGRLLQAQVSSLRHILVADELLRSEEVNESFTHIPAASDNIAFLQYTSGSTGTPKGVVLTHANLLANIRAMGDVVEASSEDVFVSWLPLYHDMGLIGAWLGSLYFAMPLVLMSPLMFLTRPYRWLQAIHKHKGTLSAAPNFAYEFCLNKLNNQDIQGIDLSSWRMAFNGAEPVNPRTLREFAERFSHFGFHPEAIAPVYGLAESAVGLAFPPPGRGALIDCIRRDALAVSGEAIPADENDEFCLEIAACGQPLPGYQIRIVDASGRELPERRQGRLQFRGPSATSGYFRNPEQTLLLFDGDWLETGDLAYMSAGDIYLTGRSKEIIIRAGRNIYPYELEQAIGEIEGIRKGCVAVFGSLDKSSGTERIVVLAETRETDPEQREQLHTQVDAVAASLLLGSSPDEIMLLPPHSVLKTSSGKIRRTACRDLYEQGLIGRASRSVSLQLLRVAAAGVLPQSRKLWHRLKDSLFALWSWGWFSLLAPLTWLAVVALPISSWRWHLIRGASRLFAFITGTPLRIEGLENLPGEQAAVMVCNHASYLDGILLIAALPIEFSFVAKKELQKNFISRLFLQRIDCLFVERFDVQQGAADAKLLQQQIQQGRSLVIFPEGTFTRESGLRAFRMGAFTTAAQVNKAVIPLTLSGTRSILRAASWYPRHGAVRVHISEPIYPQAADWDAAIRLRDAARSEILRHSGEPDRELG